MANEEKRKARGREMRRVDRSVYKTMADNYELMRPDSYKCSGCPQWDDINGCWDNNESIETCTRMGEECVYLDPDCRDEDEGYPE